VKESYVILIRLPKARTITIGSLREVHFPRGHYAYVGSALGGLEARLSRHLKPNKKLHWHIDYLLQKALVTDIITGEADGRLECAISRALGTQFDSISGFGSSDCPCPSHLFFAAEGRQLKSAVVKAFELLEIPPRLIEVRSKPK